jgi:hypothetical protein
MSEDNIIRISRVDLTPGFTDWSHLEDMKDDDNYSCGDPDCDICEAERKEGGEEGPANLLKEAFLIEEVVTLQKRISELEDVLRLVDGFLLVKGYSENDPLVRGAIKAALAGRGEGEA